MIKITQSPSYTYTINAELPGDNGKHIRTSFGLVFARLSQEELEDMQKRVQAPAFDKEGNENPEKMNDDGVIQRVVIGFGDDVLDEDGKPLAFSVGNLVALCNIYPLRSTIVKAYYKSIESAKAKN